MISTIISNNTGHPVLLQEGKCWPARLSWLLNIRHWSGLQVEQFFRVATDCDSYHELIYMVTTNA